MTVTEVVASPLSEPLAFAVTFAVPMALAKSIPLSSTSTTLVLLDFQVSVLSEALTGMTVPCI